jgi:hypothetical protein
MKLNENKKKLLNKNIFYLLLATFLLFILSPITEAAVSQTINNIIDHNWLPNGAVNAIEITTNTIYVGGNFTYLGPYKGSAFIYNNFGLTTDLEHKINGIVWTAIPDGNGGWYVGGDFHRVGNYNISNLVHINSNGRIDTNFNVRVDNTVYSLALDSNNKILFIGGAFEWVNDKYRKHLAAIRLGTNTQEVLDNFNLEFEDYVFTLALHPNPLNNPDKNILYAGGQFTYIKNNANNSSSTKAFLTAISYSTTTTSTIKEDFNTQVDDVVWTILISGQNPDYLYVGGYFTQPTPYLTAVNSSNGIRINNFNPNVDFAVLALAYNDQKTITTSDDYLYIGGKFASPKTYLAALNAINGDLISTFNPSFVKDDNDVDAVLALAFDEINNRLYVGGSFNDINTTLNGNRYYLRALNATSGALLNTDLPDRLSDRVNILKLDNLNNLFIGGRFYSYGGKYKKYLAAFDRNFQNFKEDFLIEPNEPVENMLFNPNNNYLYFSGSFYEIYTPSGTATRKFLAAINTQNNTLTSAPNLNFSTSSGDFISSLTLDRNNNKIYLCGYFTTGTYRYLARLDGTSNNLETITSSAIVDDLINDCVFDNNNRILYIGGRFKKVLGADRPYLAAIRIDNLSLVSDFNPNINDLVRTIDIDSQEGFLFVGGNFTFPSNYLAILNKNTGNTSSISDIAEYPNLPVIKVKSDQENNILFVSGFFDETTRETRDKFFIAKYNLSSFNLTPDLLYPDYYIYSIKIDPDLNTLYLGGNFEGFEYNGEYHPYKNLGLFAYLASQPPKNPTPNITSISPTSSLANQTVNLSVNGSNFVNGAVVVFNNSATLTTNFVSSILLRATIAADLIRNIGTYTLKVVNPAPCVNNNCSSNQVNFVVYGDSSPGGGTTTGGVTTTGGGGGSGGGDVSQNPIPVINTIYPTSTSINDNYNIELKITGSNFVNSSIVFLNNNQLNTTFVSSNELKAVILRNYLNQVGSYSIRVYNTPPGGGYSNQVNFIVYREESYVITTSTESQTTETSTTSTSSTTAITQKLLCSQYRAFDFKYIKNKIPQEFRFPSQKLKFRSKGINVKYLQIILNSNNLTQVASKGVGSKNKETTLYAIKTVNAIKKFQKNYLKYKKPTGIFDLRTINEFNKILDCAFK